MRVFNAANHLAKKAVRAAALSAVMIVVNCSGPQPEGETDTYGGTKDTNFGVAHAASAIPDASTDAQAKQIMPENPAQITLRLPKAAEIMVKRPLNKEWPYLYSVTEAEDFLFVTLYLPMGVPIKLEVSPLDSEGEVVGDPVLIELEPNAKLGTTELKLDGSDPPVHFSPAAQQPLQWGSTLLTKQATDEFVVGDMHKVQHGIFIAEEDSICQVSWQGCGTVISFLDEKPVTRTQPFVVSLRKGQTFGLYPQLDDGEETVHVTLQNAATCTPEE
jgi:hypothetical protein